MDAPFTDLRMESSNSLNSLDPGLGFGFVRRSTSCIHAVVRRDDAVPKDSAFLDAN